MSENNILKTILSPYWYEKLSSTSFINDATNKDIYNP